MNWCSLKRLQFWIISNTKWVKYFSVEIFSHADLLFSWLEGFILANIMMEGIMIELNTLKTAIEGVKIDCCVNSSSPNPCLMII